MPHIIVEYSQGLEAGIPDLLQELHDALALQDGVDKNRIKTRAIGYKNLLVGEKGAEANMLHVCLQVLSGRDVSLKQTYGQALYRIMNTYAPEECSVTLEVRDMERASYCS